MDFLGNQMMMDFPENRMGDGFSRGSNGDSFLLPPPPSMIVRVAGCRHQWQPMAPSSLQPWFSTIATAFISLGDVEREGKREKEGRERERGGYCGPMMMRSGFIEEEGRGI